MNQIAQIAAFIATYENHSFAKAAQELSCSTATISRHISQLEQHLGVLLFKRSTRFLKLTPAGEMYLSHCKTLLDQLNMAENILKENQKEVTGRLWVVCSRFFASQAIMPNLKNFLALHPKLQLQLELAERFPDLKEEPVDLIFGMSIEDTPNLVRKRIAKTRYVLCASPQYLKKYGIPQTPKELKQHRYITHSMRIPKNKLFFKNDVSIELEPYLQMNDTMAMLNAALNDIGIVNLHLYKVHSHLQSKALIELLPNQQNQEQGIYLYYARTPFLPKKIRAFIDFFSPIANQVNTFS